MSELLRPWKIRLRANRTARESVNDSRRIHKLLGKLNEALGDAWQYGDLVATVNVVTRPKYPNSNKGDPYDSAVGINITLRTVDELWIRDNVKVPRE